MFTYPMVSVGLSFVMAAVQSREMISWLEESGDFGHEFGPCLVRQFRRLHGVIRDAVRPLGGDEDVYS